MDRLWREEPKFGGTSLLEGPSLGRCRPGIAMERAGDVVDGPFGSIGLACKMDRRAASLRQSGRHSAAISMVAEDIYADTETRKSSDVCQPSRLLRALHQWPQGG